MRGPEGDRGTVGMFFNVIVEVGRFGKTEPVGNLFDGNRRVF